MTKNGNQVALHVFERIIGVIVCAGFEKQNNVNAMCPSSIHKLRHQTTLEGPPAEANVEMGTPVFIVYF